MGFGLTREAQKLEWYLIEYFMFTMKHIKIRRNKVL